MEITLTISKPEVMKEVAQTTSYTGAKKVGDDGALDRIATVDEDQPELQRFWDESRAGLVQALIRVFVSDGMDGDNYEVKLSVPGNYNMTLLPSMQLELFSYFVYSITGKWYVYSNKEEAGAYAEMGDSLLQELMEKSLYRDLHERKISTF
jgi:hypothetical protein